VTGCREDGSSDWDGEGGNQQFEQYEHHQGQQQQQQRQQTSVVHRPMHTPATEGGIVDNCTDSSDEAKDARILRLETENMKLVDENKQLRLLLELAADKIEQCLF
jgi:hypothetical protein